jgi:hypothetical protein
MQHPKNRAVQFGTRPGCASFADKSRLGSPSTATRGPYFQRVRSGRVPVRRTSSKVYKTAVATPGFVGLRPPNPLCTPTVASRVATAVLLNESSPAATAAA